MIKNIFRNCLFFGIAVLFLSCSFLEEKQTGSLVFDMSEVAARAAKSDFNAKDQMEIKLTGDYEAEKAFFIMDEFTDESKTELLVTFPEIPVGSKIKAEAIIFRVFTVSGRKDLYAGTSEILEIQEGVNQLPIKLKKISTDVNDIAEYTVQHYKQNIDNDEYTLADTDDMEGKFNFKTEAKAKEYAGFTALSFEDKLINPDGSTVIKIVYDRNVHKVSYDNGVSGATITVPEAGNHRFGATVDVDFALGTRAGYDFAGWKNTATGEVFKSDDKKSFTMGDADVTLTAQWTASSDTRYTVKHLKQNIDDDNYSEVTEDREEKTGVSLAQTNALPKSYTGFTAQPVTQKTIAEDSTTVVEIKYDRNTYKVSYEDSVANVDISVPSDTNNYRYGATVTVDFTVGTSTGHTFKGWKDTESGTIYNSGTVTSFEIGAGDVTLYAQWEANTYTITYTRNGGSWASGYEAPSSYTYGEPLNLPDADDIVLAGYGLTGWFTTPTFDSGTKLTEIAAGTTEPVTVYAQWTVGATTYKVHHLLQDVEGSGYTEATEDLQTLAGVSEENTAAEAKSYDGFNPITPITQEPIAGDGTTEITIKYDRKTYTVSYANGLDVTHGLVKDDSNNAMIPSNAPTDIPSTTQTLRYGAIVTVDEFAKPDLDGYQFTYWTDDEGIPGSNTYSGGQTFELPARNIVLTANWEPRTSVSYDIVFMWQKTDEDDYDEFMSFQQTGTTGQSTQAANYTETYPGFTMQSPIEEKKINPDGTTRVEVYYNRKTYTIIYDRNAGSETVPDGWPTDSTAYRYNSFINLPNVSSTTLARTGYTFAGWTKSQNPANTDPVYNYGDATKPTMNPADPDNDTSITLYAKWTIETQNTGIDVGFGIDTSTINVTISGTTATADVSALPGDGTCTYAWTVDGAAQSSTTSTLNLSSFTTVGVYDITLTVTKNSKEYTWTGQYIKS